VTVGTGVATVVASVFVVAGALGAEVEGEAAATVPALGSPGGPGLEQDATTKNADKLNAIDASLPLEPDRFMACPLGGEVTSGWNDVTTRLAA
jgi:hypothetical protein